MNTPLKLAQGFSLPLDAVTQKFAILAMSGAGKTTASKVLTEGMLANNQPVVIFDPVGVWWGLRLASDGKGDGFPVLTIGGDKGDIPISGSAGESVADLLVGSGRSAIVDLSLLDDGDQQRVVADFARKAIKTSNSPLHLVLDEADVFAPETSRSKHQENCRQAICHVAQRGRVKGLGLTVICQRSSLLNKTVLTQCGTLVALRTSGSQDLKAIENWVSAFCSKQDTLEVIRSLPSLENGEAWIVSPSWLKHCGRARILLPDTYDSSKTPVAGAVQVAPKPLTGDALASAKEKLAAAAAEFEANDVDALRARVSSLKAQLEAKGTVVVSPARERELESRIHCQEQEIRNLRARTSEAVVRASDAISEARRLLAGEDSKVPLPPRPPELKPEPVPVKETKPDPEDPDLAGRLKPGQMKVLSALQRLHPMHLTLQQLATLACMSPGSGTFTAYLAVLSDRGNIQRFVAEEKGKRVSVYGITAAGVAAAGGGAPGSKPFTVDELMGMWGAVLNGKQKAMLALLVKHYPKWTTLESLAKAVEMSPGSGTFGSYISILRRYGLADTDRMKNIRASETLFLGSPKL